MVLRHGVSGTESSIDLRSGEAIPAGIDISDIMCPISSSSKDLDSLASCSHERIDPRGASDEDFFTRREGGLSESGGRGMTRGGLNRDGV